MLFLFVVSCVLVELRASLDSLCSLKFLEDKKSLEEIETSLRSSASSREEVERQVPISSLRDQ